MNVAGNRPLHVMHLVLKLGFGGAEGGVVRLVNGFDRSRVRPSICSCWPADAIKSRLYQDVPLFEMDRRINGNDPGFVVRLARLLRRERPDVLHTHGWATLCEGRLAAWLAGVPMMVHGEHGTMETRGRNLLLQRLIWPRCDRILSVSSRLTDKLAATVGFPGDRIVTIRNGVDAERFHPGKRNDARAGLDIGSGDLVVGTVGRLHPVKDQHNLIRALGGLARSGLRFTAVIAGDGPIRGELSDLARAEGLASTVRFLGERSDIEQVLAALDVFVLSSKSEGLSNTILEAMASGVPVVATEVGGADELVVANETGLLVPPGDPGRLAAAIRVFAESPDRRHAMGAAGRRRAESQFGLTQMVRDYEDVYVALARRETFAPAFAGGVRAEGER